MLTNRVSKSGGDLTHISPIVADETGETQDSAIQQGSTTNFVSDGPNVSVGTIQAPLDIGSMFSSNPSTYKQQDICEFLRKPVAITNGTFSSTDTGILYTNDPWNTLFSNPIWSRKVEGHLAIRGDLHLKLVVNATRFQQGRYCMAWFPTLGASAPTNQSTAWYNLHVANLTSRTQLPHVEIDLNRDTECSMIIPFISAYSHKFVKVSTFTDPGYVLLFPYAPLVAPVGSTIAHYTLYAHFENVTLEAPTQPQSAVRFRSKVDVQSGEQKTGGIGPITSTLSKVSKASGILSQIPLLSSVAAPVSWFTDILSNAASVFGWSSPLDLSEVTRAVQTIVPYSNNVDMPDGSMPLSLFARNKIETLPGLGGTDIDEMSIDHIKTIPAYFKQFTLSTSNTATSLIDGFDCGYTNYTTSFVDNGRTHIVHAPISYCAMFFNQARGGLIFRFKVVSTEFHSGRYAFVFTPYDLTSGGRVTNFGGNPYTHREIIDLRMGNEFTFHVPYTSILPYRTLGSSSGANTNEYFGSVAVYCINPLRAPDTVSSTVTVLVEVAGAPDVEFAALRTNGYSLAVPSAPQSSIKFVSNASEITSGDIGNSMLTDDKMMSARHCVGERVLSFNSILKHTDRFIPDVQNTTHLSAVIDPFTIMTRAFVGATNSDAPFASDLYSMIVAMYGLSRGSTRWRIFNNTPTSANSMERNRAFISYDRSNVASGGIAGSVSSLTSRRWVLSVSQNQIYRGCVEVQTPPYHHTFARTNVNNFVGSGILLGNNSFASASGMILNVETSAANGNIYKRQVADDFQCSVFISTPCTTIL